MCEVRNILRHSRNTPSFPQHSVIPARRESTIPAHAGIHSSHSPKPEKNTPPFPQKNTSPSVIPAKAGMTLTISRNTPSFPRRIHNSRARGTQMDSPKAGIEISGSVITQQNSVIPAKAGITSRHSREFGNGWPPIPQFPRTREFTIPLLQSPRKTLRHSHNTPSFPRRRE